MKNLFLITLSILLLASCGKTPQNGNLDGQWIMQEMYSKKDVNSTEYIKADRANPTIWNVSLSMILISTPGTNHNGQTGTTTCKMIYKGDKLSITHTFIHHRTEDLLITDPNYLFGKCRHPRQCLRLPCCKTELFAPDIVFIARQLDFP